MKYKKYTVIFQSLFVILLALTVQAKEIKYNLKYKIYNSRGEQIGKSQEKIDLNGTEVKYNKLIEFNNGDKVAVNSLLNKTTLFLNKHELLINKKDELMEILLKNKNGFIIGTCFDKKIKVNTNVVPLSLLQFWIHCNIIANPNIGYFTLDVLDDLHFKILKCKIKIVKKYKDVYNIIYNFKKMNFTESWDMKRNLSELKQGNSILISEGLKKSKNYDLRDISRNNLLVKNSENKLNNLYFGERILEISLNEDIEIPNKSYQVVEKLNNKNSFNYLVKINYNIENGFFNCGAVKYEDNNTINKTKNVTDLCSSLFKKAKSDNEKICVAFQWIKENINLKEGVLTDPEFVLSKRKGDCEGISNLFQLIMQHENIKTKLVWGIIFKSVNQSIIGIPHQWIKVFIDNEWKSVDPTFGLIKLTNNYLELSIIDDIEDYFSVLKILNNIEIEIRR